MWATASANFTTTQQAAPLNTGCGGILANPTSSQVVQTLTLPNGSQYQFHYDTHYGLLKKITYPNGGSYNTHVVKALSLSL